MAVFVGSNSDDSRIRSNRVGFAASTSNPASASEGDAYYNSGDSKLNVYDGSSWTALGGSSGSLSGTVSGTISDGQAVIIKSDGNLAGVTTSVVGVATGSRSTYETGESYFNTVVYDSINKKVVIAYTDGNDSNKPKAVVGTVSGSSIGFGTATYVYPDYANVGTAGRRLDGVFDDDTGTVNIVWQYGTSDTGTAYVKTGKVVGNSIVFDYRTSGGLEISSHGGGTNTAYPTITYDKSAKRIVAGFRHANSNGYGEAVVLRTNGTGSYRGRSYNNSNDTMPESYIFNSGSTNYPKLCYDDVNEKVIFGYTNGESTKVGSVRVGTVTPENYSISFGSTAVFYNNDTYMVNVAYHSDAERLVVTYQDGNNSFKGTAVVGTVTGTAVTFGTPVVFSTGAAYSMESRSTIYDPIGKKILVSYRDGGDSNYGKVAVGTVDGDTISFEINRFNDNTSYNIGIGYDSDSRKTIIACRDVGNSEQGTARVYNPTFDDTNLTEGNFAGISAGAYTNGQTGSVQIEGIVDDAQTGLTTGAKHYVKNDGSISSKKDFPIVEAGTAVSATKLLVERNFTDTPGLNIINPPPTFM